MFRETNAQPAAPPAHAPGGGSGPAQPRRHHRHIDWNLGGVAKGETSFEDRDRALAVALEQIKYAEAAQHMNQTGRVLDCSAEAPPFFAAPHAFGEAAGGRETLGQVAAANHREHRGGAEALMAALRADVAD